MKKTILISLLAFFVFSCSKEGLNGNATVVVTLKFNGNPVINHSYPDTVYVKFNATDLPGFKPSDYDASFAGVAGQGFVKCEKLKWGDYYLFAAGFDSTISTRLTGGMHIKIKHKNRKDETDTDIIVNQ